MTLLDISLIIIGIVIIYISYKFFDKTPNSNQDIDTYLSKVNLENKIESIITEEIEKAENELKNISNEKIISVNDFSEQVLEKIKYSHDEVVFLYNMLTEKEDNIKKLLIQTKDKQNDDKQKDDKTINTVEEKLSKDEISGNLKDKYNGQTNYDLVLTLFKEGKSVLDISKTLNIGQGEVKLIVDLETR